MASALDRLKARLGEGRYFQTPLGGALPKLPKPTQLGNSPHETQPKPTFGSFGSAYPRAF